MTTNKKIFEKREIGEELAQFLDTVNAQLDFGKTQKILETLIESEELLNLDELSIKSGINRSSLNKYLSPLELLCYVSVNKRGASKYLAITPLGERVYNKFFNK